MKLNLFVPGTASSSKPAPVLFYLAGLTCTGDNGAEKGFFRLSLYYLALHFAALALQATVGTW